MIDKRVLQSAREVLGNYISETMKERKINMYQLEKLTGKPAHQLKAVITGEENYTMDTFLTIIQSLDLYIFFAPKDGKHLDFNDMNKKMEENDPNL